MARPYVVPDWILIVFDGFAFIQFLFEILIRTNNSRSTASSKLNVERLIMTSGPRATEFNRNRLRFWNILAPMIDGKSEKMPFSNQRLLLFARLLKTKK